MRDVKIFTDNIDGKAKNQIYELSDIPAFEGAKIRIMPDVHAGAGCVIGFTGNLGNKIIPNIVGVDIGCGMLTVNLGSMEVDVERLDKIIREYVPSGYNVNENVIDTFPITKLLCIKELDNMPRIERSMGSLGGGNHFIELDIDDEGNKYLIIHSGSRNLGKQVCDYYQNKAIDYISGKDKLRDAEKELIENLKKNGKQQDIQKELIKLREKFSNLLPNMPKDLCYLEGKDAEDYLHDMKLCQEFASRNRMNIAYTILTKYFGLPRYSGYRSVRLREHCGSGYFETQDMVEKDFRYFETVHNYISFEDNIVRKGAISARYGEKVLIPINMRDGCIIGIGKGNNDWNQSAPHGAGRIMSRSEAREKINMDEYQASMKGIFTTSVNEGTRDEAPMVYKPMEEIIRYIGDTIDIVKIIKPIYNFKASEEEHNGRL